MKIPEILLVESLHERGSLAKILQVIADCGLVVEHMNAVRRDQDKTIWEITLEMDADNDTGVYDRIDALPNARFLGKSDRVFNRHEGGKIQMIHRKDIGSLQELRDIYTPGVARVCLAIREKPELAYKYTNLKNTVAIITNGTAILGLGDIGALAGLPVIEGKAVLMSQFAGISGIPILLDHTDPEHIIDAIMAIEQSFGAIQLEDIAGPACFEVEEELKKRLAKPVLHDDQHGTAVVALAAMLSASKRIGRKLEDGIIGQIGLGAAGIGISRLAIACGARRVMGTDLSEPALQRLEEIGGERASLEKLMAEADVVVATTGVPGLIKPDMVRKGQMILALSNPDPEIEPHIALERGAAFAADGKGINNVLGFPGLFRGALDAGATHFTDGMLWAAAKAISDLAPDDELVPGPLDKSVHEAVAKAVQEAAERKLEKKRQD
ncbi:MAG TPA: malic enzyme-like NAD(P)-binding protein [Gammaproteobacteria bacterium]|nr:malic enzyme-like NAD(P)-binding protein [Gammaproteobacteria bacterium]